MNVINIITKRKHNLQSDFLNKFSHKRYENLQDETYLFVFSAHLHKNYGVTLVYGLIFLFGFLTENKK